MSSPEDIPEDRCPSYPCNCGGNITQDVVTGNWECDQCNFNMPDSSRVNSNPPIEDTHMKGESIG